MWTVQTEFIELSATGDDSTSKWKIGFEHCQTYGKISILFTSCQCVHGNISLNKNPINWSEKVGAMFHSYRLISMNDSVNYEIVL